MLAAALKDASFALARPALPEISKDALRVAQIHPSATSSKAVGRFECSEDAVEDYAVYAAIGLKYLNLAVAQCIFETYPKLMPDVAEILLLRMISKETLAAVAFAHRLYTPILMYAQAERATNLDDELVRMELVAARIGAAYSEDAEDASLKAWISQTFTPLIKIEYEVLKTEPRPPTASTVNAAQTSASTSSAMAAPNKAFPQPFAPNVGGSRSIPAARPARSETLQSDGEDDEEPEYKKEANYVGILLEHIQKLGLSIKLDEEYSDFGKDHVKEFHCKLMSSSQGEIGFGAATTKKEAKRR